MDTQTQRALKGAKDSVVFRNTEISVYSKLTLSRREHTPKLVQPSKMLHLHTHKDKMDLNEYRRIYIVKGNSDQIERSTDIFPNN